MPFNEASDGQKINQVLSRYLGVEGAPAPVVASEIFPILVMGSDNPEWGFLSNERRAAGFAQDGAVAGQFSHVGVSNPSGSGAIVVVERITLTNLTAVRQTHQIRIGIGLPQDANGTQKFKDTRFGISAEPTADTFLQTGVAHTGSRIWEAAICADGVVVLDGGWVLGPNGCLMVGPDTVNQAVAASFEWREYAAANGELLNAVVT